jgi:hypothetical protein
MSRAAHGTTNLAERYVAGRCRRACWPGNFELPESENVMKYVDGHVELGTDEARQGETHGTVRYVLGIGMVLAVIGLITAYLI